MNLRKRTKKNSPGKSKERSYVSKEIYVCPEKPEHACSRPLDSSLLSL
jgi:hypothetical protein